MNKLKPAIVTAVLLLAIAVPTTISAFDETVSAFDEAVSPPDENTISAPTELPVKTEHSKEFLAKENMIFQTPTTQAGISEEDANKVALEYVDVLAPNVARNNISVEYQLMTYSNFGAFSESALAKNEQLRKDGYLNNTPVYIVSLKGLDFKSLGGVPHGKSVEHRTLHEKNIVIDANSGEILFTYSYR